MKILFLCPYFYPHIGGVEKHTLEVAKKLAKKHKVTVITESLERNSREKLYGINIYRLFFGKNDWFKKFIIWWKIIKLKKIIDKADIIHCHDVFFWYLPLRLIYPRKKVYITFHGYETAFPVETKAIFIRKLSEKLSSGNIAIGEYISKWYGTSPTYVTYGAVSGIKNLKFKIKNYNSKLKILFIGRIEEDTGVKIYSDVLKGLKNFHFEACGDGSLRTNLEKFGKVHGFVKNLSKYIQSADIVFASSYLSIFEALSLKKPVFSAFDNPLKENYLRMTPFSKWIYIEKSPTVLIRKINQLKRNKRLTEKKSNLAYNWVREQTWDKVTQKYLELWTI